MEDIIDFAGEAALGALVTVILISALLAIFTGDGALKNVVLDVVFSVLG